MAVDVEELARDIEQLSEEDRRELLRRIARLDLTEDELDWLRLSEPSFDFWDNEEDAVYDEL